MAKILEKELESNVSAKLNYLEPVVKNYNPAAKKSLVAFNGTTFSNEYFEDSQLNRIVSDDEINDLVDSIGTFTPKTHIDTNLNKAFNMNNIKPNCFKSLGVLQDSLAEIKLKAKILKLVNIDSYMLVLTEAGNIYKINIETKQAEFSINFIDIIKSKFAVSELYAADVLDLNIYNDSILVSTQDNGVFSIKSKDEISNIIAENDIIRMEVFGDKLFTIIPRDEDNVIVFDLATGRRLEVFNQLRRLHQVPIRMKRSGKRIFVLGKNFDRNDTFKILHCWAEDDAQLTFNSIDYRFQNIKTDDHLLPRFIEVDKENLYLACFRKGSFVLFKYPLNRISKYPEKLVYHIDGLDFMEASSIAIYNDTVLAGFDNKLIEVTPKKIEKILLLKNKSINHLMKIGNNIYYYGAETIYQYAYPAYQDFTNFSLVIYNSDKLCNNIDIFIKGQLDNLKFALVDGDANQFKPTLAVNRPEGIYIKISNSSAKKIFLKLTVDNTVDIEGIAVHKNQIYYRS